MSDSDSSEDSDDARRRAEILSCVVTTDEVRASGSGPPPRSDEQPSGGFREHSARKLHALLDSRVHVSDGVWEARARRAKKRLKAAPASPPRSELRLFVASTTLHAHGEGGSPPVRAADAGTVVDAVADPGARRERKRDKRERREQKREKREKKRARHEQKARSNS